MDVAAEFTSLPDSAPHSMAAPSEGVYVFLCRSPGPPAASASRAPSAPFTRPCIPTVPRGGETHPSGVWEPAVHRNETDTLTTDGVPVQVRFFPLLFCAYPCGFELARRSFELARPSRISKLSARISRGGVCTGGGGGLWETLVCCCCSVVRHHLCSSHGTC